MAVLSLSKHGYKNPKDSHLHGTSGPMLSDSNDTTYLTYQGTRAFSHGCSRRRPRAITAMRFAVPPGTPVQFVK